MGAGLNSQESNAEGAPELGGLNWRQRQFVCFYLGAANGNATQAARLAGYANPESNAYRLLLSDGVQAAILARLDEAALRTDEILARLSDIATADLSDFVKCTASGFSLDLEHARQCGKTHLIKKLSNTKHGVAIELHDAQAALVHLGRYRKLFVDRVEHELRDKSDQQLLALAQAEGLTGRDREAGTDTSASGD